MITLASGSVCTFCKSRNDGRLIRSSTDQPTCKALWLVLRIRDTTLYENLHFLLTIYAFNQRDMDIV